MKRTGFAPRTTPMKRTAMSRCAITPDTAKLTVKVKNRKCRACKTPFKTFSTFVSWCSPECGAVVGVKALEKQSQAIALADRADTKKRLEAIKPRAKWLAEAQAAFNAFIRARDAHLPCISCGRYHLGSHDAGHYRSVGSNPALRFHEDNCHRQCVPCNQHKSGNIVEYRIGLLIKIGATRLAFLEGSHEAKKYSIDEIKAIKTSYKQKTKELKAREAAC